VSFVELENGEFFVISAVVFSIGSNVNFENVEFDINPDVFDIVEFELNVDFVTEAKAIVFVEFELPVDNKIEVAIVDFCLSVRLTYVVTFDSDATFLVEKVVNLAKFFRLSVFFVVVFRAKHSVQL
jgi:hypothetical protein